MRKITSPRTGPRSGLCIATLTPYALAVLLLFQACKRDDTTSLQDLQLPEPQGEIVGSGQTTSSTNPGMTTNALSGQTERQQTVVIQQTQAERDIKYITSLLMQKSHGFGDISNRLINKTRLYTENDRFPLDCINYCCSRIGKADNQYKIYFDRYVERLLTHPEWLESHQYQKLKTAWNNVDPDTDVFFQATEAYKYLFDNKD